MLRIKNVFRIFALLVVLGVVVTACSDEIEVQQSEVIEGNMRISYTIDGLDNGDPKSRAEVSATPEETRLNDVYVLFFSADAPYRYIGRSTKGLVENGIFSITKPDFIASNVSYKTLIVGNGEDNIPTCDKAPSPENQSPSYDTYGAYIDDIATINTSTKAEVEANLCSQGLCELNKLPMYGEFIDGNGEPAEFHITDEGMIGGTVRFKRSVVRLELALSGELAGLNITKVALCNQPRRGFFCHSGTEVSTVQNYQKVGIMDISNTADTHVWHTWKDRNIFYVYPTTIERPEKYDVRTLCFMIEAEETVGGKVQKKYYRLNVTNPGYSQKLERNKSYLVTINEKKSQGEMHMGWAYNPEAAIVLEPVLDVADDGIAIDENGIYVVDGFDPSTDLAKLNGCTDRPLHFKVYCQSQYRVQVMSTFDKYIDAYLSVGEQPNPTTMNYSKANPPKNQVPDNDGVKRSYTDILESGTDVWLNVFRTGPGDPDFYGKISFQLFKDGVVVPIMPEVVTVCITTPCVIGDAVCDIRATPTFDSNFDYTYITHGGGPTSWQNLYLNDHDHFVVADRNFGATPRMKDGKYNPAYNYTHCFSHVCGGYSEPENDPTRAQWEGILNRTDDPRIACCDKRLAPHFRENPTGWIDPESPWYDEASIKTYYPLMGVTGIMENANPAYCPWAGCYEMRYWGDATHLYPSITQNFTGSKMRGIIISDYLDPKTGKYVACYLQWVNAKRQMVPNSNWNYAYFENKDPFNGPSFNYTHYGIGFDYQLKRCISMTGYEGTTWYVAVSVERPIRWIKKTMWANLAPKFKQPKTTFVRK